jgi:hypothetical protein
LMEMRASDMHLNQEQTSAVLKPHKDYERMTRETLANSS